MATNKQIINVFTAEKGNQRQAFRRSVICSSCRLITDAGKPNHNYGLQIALILQAQNS